MNIAEQIESFVLSHLHKGVVVLAVGLSQAAFREFLSLCASLDDIDKSGKLAPIRIFELEGTVVPIQALQAIQVK